jgi:hypothetical protein
LKDGKGRDSYSDYKMRFGFGEERELGRCDDRRDIGSIRRFAARWNLFWFGWIFKSNSRSRHKCQASASGQQGLSSLEPWKHVQEGV